MICSFYGMFMVLYVWSSKEYTVHPSCSSTVSFPKHRICDWDFLKLGWTAGAAIKFELKLSVGRLPAPFFYSTALGVAMETALLSFPHLYSSCLLYYSIILSFYPHLPLKKSLRKENRLGLVAHAVYRTGGVEWISVLAVPKATSLAWQFWADLVSIFQKPLLPLTRWNPLGELWHFCIQSPD